MNILNGHFKPMEPVLCPAPFDSEEFTYQVKWDGVRILSYINKNRVELRNKKNNLRTIQYPELANLTQILTGEQAVLDGEIVVLKNGKPSFSSVMRRDRSSSPSTITYLQTILPVQYMIFDLIQYKNQDLTDRPLSYRKQLLTEVFNQQPGFYLVDDFLHGQSLFESVKAQDLEGIVAKKIHSRYLPGKHHKDWFKIKYRRRQNCVIGGYSLRNNFVNSLLVGVYQNNRLVFAGKAGSGLKTSEWQQLSIELPLLKIDVSPFINLPGHTNTEIKFIEPKLVVKIEFAEWTEDIHLRSPVITGFINVDPKECTIE